MAFNPFGFLSCGIKVLCKGIAITFMVLYLLAVIYCTPFVMSAEASCLGYGYFEYGKHGLHCAQHEKIRNNQMKIQHVGPMRFFNMNSPQALRHSMIAWLLMCVIMLAGHILLLIGNMKLDKRLVLGHPSAVLFCAIVAIIASIMFSLLGEDGFFPWWLLVHLPLEIVAVAATVSLFLQIKEEEEEDDDSDEE